ncbi:hypothetical protein JXA32_06410 [Candidatus Sumerlaeota bacterium]|nr:hypothetical protein [Candidatus Sumerlaeota bacterium]
MKLYKCIVKVGHVGSGKYVERPVFVWARDAMEAMQKAKSLGGVKKGRQKRTGSSVLEVQPADAADADEDEQTS